MFCVVPFCCVWFLYYCVCFCVFDVFFYFLLVFRSYWFRRYRSCLFAGAFLLMLFSFVLLSLVCCCLFFVMFVFCFLAILTLFFVIVWCPPGFVYLSWFRLSVLCLFSRFVDVFCFFSMFVLRVCVLFCACCCFLCFVFVSLSMCMNCLFALFMCLFVFCVSCFCCCRFECYSYKYELMLYRLRVCLSRLCYSLLLCVLPSYYRACFCVVDVCC